MPPVVVAVALVKHIGGAPLDIDLLPFADVVDVGCGDARISHCGVVHVQQQMQLDAMVAVGAGVPAQLLAAPRQAHGARIQQVQQLLALRSGAAPGLRDQRLQQLRKDQRAALLVRIRQSGPAHEARCQVIVVIDLRVKARLQLAQAVRAGQLHVQHGHQLIPAGELLDVSIALVELNGLGKGATRHRLQNLLDSTYAVHVAGWVVERFGDRGSNPLRLITATPKRSRQAPTPV